MKPLSKIPPSSVRPGMPPSTGAHSAESHLHYYVGPANRFPAKPILPLFPHESEDARLTGETRSLFRRLLALNLPVAASGTTSVNMIQSRVGKIA